MTQLELVDVVDENDNVIGTKNLEECLKFGLLHRVVSIFLKNSRGEIFLQQRSKKDDWLPGLWTVSCTGHVKSKEEPNDAAAREINEELGISCSPNFLFKFVVPLIRAGDKIEREISMVYEAKSNDSLKLDHDEVEDGKFLSLEDCKEFFSTKSKEITLDARLAFEKYTALQR